MSEQIIHTMGSAGRLLIAREESWATNHANEASDEIGDRTSLLDSAIRKACWQ